MNIKIEGYQVTFREEKSRNKCTLGKNLSYFDDYWNGGISYRTFKNKNNEGRGHNMLKVYLLWYVFMYF